MPQHVIQRGNNREPCFLVEQDYRRYLDDLHATAEKYHCRIQTYVLMTNHVHLLMTPMQEHGVADLMQALGRRYVYYINKTYGRTGTLWPLLRVPAPAAFVNPFTSGRPLQGQSGGL